VAKISLPLIGLEVEPELWDSLIRQFSVEEQYEGSFIAKDFLELTTHSQDQNPDTAITDSLDLIKFASRRRFADALLKKYRIGSEFADNDDANVIFDQVFVSAEATAMGSLSSSAYTFDTLIYVELFYWVMLQLLRIDRGEYIDRKNQGNQVRLGANMDLSGFEGLASDFYTED
jgi:hypothetical protein